VPWEFQEETLQLIKDMQTQTVNITGTTCPACKKLIEKRIFTISDITGVNVDFKSGKSVIESNRPISKEEINKVLEELPYEAN